MVQTGRGNWQNFEQRTKVERFFLRYRAQRATSWNNNSILNYQHREYKSKFGTNMNDIFKQIPTTKVKRISLPYPQGTRSNKLEHILATTPTKTAHWYVNILLRFSTETEATFQNSLDLAWLFRLFGVLLNVKDPLSTKIIYPRTQSIYEGPLLKILLVL